MALRLRCVTLVFLATSVLCTRYRFRAPVQQVDTFDDLPPTVKAFSTSYSDFVSKYVLRNVYVVHMTPEDAEIAMYTAVMSALNKLNLGAISKNIADVVSGAVEANFALITPEKWVTVYGNLAGRALYDHGKLRPGNEKALAEEFVEKLKEVSASTIKEGHPETQIQAWSDSFVNFMVSEGIFDLKSVPTYAVIYQNEVFKAAVN